MRHFTVRPMVLAAPPAPPVIPSPRRPT
jgi:hypothetical protein